MKPWKTLAGEPMPEGEELVLQERDGVFALRVGGRELMSSARHGSEEAMAEAGLAGLEAAPPSVLVGGLGFGYTLRATLDRLPAAAQVLVVEISRAVVEWNRGPLAHLAGNPLGDPRVSLGVGDVGDFIAAEARRFDALLLDVDNGPSALSRAGNQLLYERQGIRACARALRPGGRLVVWSASSAGRYLQRLRSAGFEAQEQRARARPGGRSCHVLITARLAAAGR